MLTFRAATPADHDVLVGFVKGVAREAEGETLDAARVARGVGEALADPRHRQYYVAELHGEAIGCCLITTEWSDWTGRWYWWFQSVYVAAQHRGPALDVWGRLYAWIAGEARRVGVEKLLLYVNEGNDRAQRAYRRVGMRRVAQAIFEAKVP